MESKQINACLFASDAQLHFVRVSLYSFIEKNHWFSGTVFLLVHPDFPLAPSNLNKLKLIYPTLSILTVSSNSKFLMQAKRNKITYISQIAEYLKGYIFSLNQTNLLYFSNTCLFMKDVTAVLHNKKICFTSDKSIVYLGEKVLISKNSLNTESFSSDSFFNLTLVEKDTHEISDIGLKASEIKDSKFNQLKPYIDKTRCIFYNDLVLNHNINHYQKIKQVWLHKNNDVTRYLASPKNINLTSFKKAGPEIKVVNTVKIENVKIEAIPDLKNLVSPKDLYDYLNNKKIALVANSSILLEKNYGELIDSHDVVIRFNGYPTFSNHTGVKTNLHFIFREAQFNLNLPCDYLFVISNPVIPWKNAVSELSSKHKNKKIVNFNFPSAEEIIFNFKKKIIPTSGMCALLFIESLKLKKYSISLFGFTGYLGGEQSILRSNDSKLISKVHDYQAEQKYIRENFKEIDSNFLQKNKI